MSAAQQLVDFDAAQQLMRAHRTWADISTAAIAAWDSVYCARAAADQTWAKSSK
jgi:hypothetical protein